MQRLRAVVLQHQLNRIAVLDNDALQALAERGHG